MSEKREWGRRGSLSLLHILTHERARWSGKSEGKKEGGGREGHNVGATEFTRSHDGGA